MSDPPSVAALESALLGAIATLDQPTAVAAAAQLPSSTGDPVTLAALFDAQCLSRALDQEARRLRQRGRGYYTIGSSGHESNAAVAMALRPTDPALLHYRSGAFYLARSIQAGQPTDPVDDVLLGMLAATDEPIAGGRHKVWGHPGLAVIPQTSTIASHLPRAVGTAFAIGRAAKLGVDLRWPSDAVVVCSFGDASANHSTALGAINAASNMAFRGLPVPLLFVCEDNGIGISVRTPPRWIHAAFASRPGLRYEEVDGSDAVTLLARSRELADWVRRTRKPMFLHLHTVRFLGHAGTDVEAGYRTPDEIRQSYALDPLLGTAQAMRAGGVSTAEIVERYRSHAVYVAQRAEALLQRPELRTARSIMSAIAPRPEPVAIPDAAQAVPTGGAVGTVTLAQAVNAALADELAADPAMLVFGEDVGVKGGVYGVTKGLQQRFGGLRVFDTLLDEQTILGVALGTAVSGLLPVPEIQYLAYLHNAEDQIRGEAASLAFFSQGAYRNGMVVRIAGYGYQKGFGGHFHNDNSIAVLRDIPGIVIASPARAGDAAAMMKTCLSAARQFGTVSVFLEPIALYHTTDLHVAGDGAWAEPLDPGDDVPIGSIRRYGPDDAVATIITWGNGLHMALRVVKREFAGRVNVIDLRWLAPLPLDAVCAVATRRILVVDETRSTGGVSEGIVTGLIDRGYIGRVTRVASKDSFIPLGNAANLVLLSEADIAAALRQLLGGAAGG